MDVALVTCAALPGLYEDDRRLLVALRAAGHTAEPVVWEDPYQDWHAPRLCLIRSAWDYAFRRDAFVSWARTVAAATTLWNSARLVEWNTHKQYLCDLTQRGVPVVPTQVLLAGSRTDLGTLMQENGWRDVVLKAAVAQSGRYAMRVRLENVERGQAHLDRLLPFEDMLVQPYMPAVTRGGELSIVFIDGEFTHAVRKMPAPHDFRVHVDHGGSVTSVRLDARELAAAQAAVAAVGEPTLYARVDLVDDEHQQPLVMELEVVEPELFFAHHQPSVHLLVTAIERHLHT